MAVDSAGDIFIADTDQIREVLNGVQVTVTADTTPPQGSLTAANVVAVGATTYTFTVRDTDDAAVKVSTLDSNDIIVSGPNGFSQAAAFVGVDTNTDGTPRTATYQITPPGGTWNTADNGTYTVTMQTNQVSDTSGNYVPSGAPRHVHG